MDVGYAKFTIDIVKFWSLTTQKSILNKVHIYKSNLFIKTKNIHIILEKLTFRRYNRWTLQISKIQV